MRRGGRGLTASPELLMGHPPQLNPTSECSKTMLKFFSISLETAGNFYQVCDSSYVISPTPEARAPDKTHQSAGGSLLTGQGLNFHVVSVYQ